MGAHRSIYRAVGTKKPCPPYIDPDISSSVAYPGAAPTLNLPLDPGGQQFERLAVQKPDPAAFDGDDALLR